MPDQITDNPAIYLGLTGSIMLLLTAFGLSVTIDQQHAILAVESGVLAVLALWTHKVTVPKTPSIEASPSSIQDAPGGKP